MPSMDLLPINYDEFIYEPYTPEPVQEPRFHADGNWFSLLQFEPMRAKSDMSTPSFTELLVGLSFTTMMGLEDSCGSSDSQ